ncbi:PepSY domain-containing protein [Nostoc sp. PA-18-2419]|uniref:PepSY domain-containing protein n=1 Tax=Nostoc sp. PA-18-2419 TaxID=2575443 RepID=UPI001CB895F3|nr:PepSY domain-containing protein [Nostoc sp. PA-18-2419]
MMRIKQFLSRWSRTIHRWVGLYFAVVIGIYVIEIIALPPAFSSGLPTIDGKAPTQTITKNTKSLLSLEQASQAFISQHPKGINTLEDIDEITYLPSLGIYRFENQKRLFEWYLDAQNGKLLKYGFNATDFLEYRGLLGWFAPWIHNLIEMSFLFFMSTLAVSGVYLFIYPFLVKKNSEMNSTD